MKSLIMEETAVRTPPSPGGTQRGGSQVPASARAANDKGFGPAETRRRRQRRPRPITSASESEGPLHAETVAHADVLAQHRRPLPAAADLLEDPLLVEQVVELELNLYPIAREVLVDDAERVERLLERVLIAA